MHIYFQCQSCKIRLKRSQSSLHPRAAERSDSCSHSVTLNSQGEEYGPVLRQTKCRNVTLRDWYKELASRIEITSGEQKGVSGLEFMVAAKQMLKQILVWSFPPQGSWSCRGFSEAIQPPSSQNCNQILQMHWDAWEHLISCLLMLPDSSSLLHNSFQHNLKGTRGLYRRKLVQ